eukprot:m.1289635 g.1289635  ORF g.1289635 m.1289635 type:complete len:72 (+) comp24782_c0_seq45:4579-4794(+)
MSTSSQRRLKQANIVTVGAHASRQGSQQNKKQIGTNVTCTAVVQYAQTFQLGRGRGNLHGESAQCPACRSS